MSQSSPSPARTVQAAGWVARWRQAVRGYPTQFWLMFLGMLLATLGASMIWPYLLIYASERLNAPLAQVGSLFTINAVFAFLTMLSFSTMNDLI